MSLVLGRRGRRSVTLTPAGFGVPGRCGNIARAVALTGRRTVVRDDGR